MNWKSVFLGLVTMCNSFTPTFEAASAIFKGRIDGNKPPVYELENIVPRDTPCVLFYSGLSSFIPGEIYDEFLNNLAISGVSVYSAPPDLEESIDLLDTLVDEYANVTIIGHSSGSLNALSASNSNRNIKNLVLMDPVDSSFLISSFKDKDFTLKNIEKLLYLNAAKSYEWGLAPTNFKVPFIPAFKLTPEKIKLKKGTYTIIEADNFGHTDILNDVWADSLHESIKSGSETRENGELKEYRFWLSSQIKSFINNEELDETVVTAEEQMTDVLTDLGEFYNDVSGRLSSRFSDSLQSMKKHKLNNISVLYRKI